MSRRQRIVGSVAGPHVLISVCVGLLLCVMPLISHGQWSGQRLHRPGDVLGKYALGARAGVSMSAMRYGGVKKNGLVSYGYHFGGQGLIRFPYDLELDLGLLMLWKGGRTTGVYGTPAGSNVRLDTDVRLMFLNIPVYCNYVYKINPDVSVLGGAGFALNIGFMGNVAIKAEGNKVSRDIRYGFKKNTHYIPFDMGAVMQVGTRFFKRMQVVFWYEIDFINLNHHYGQEMPEVSKEALFIEDGSAPLLHSFGRQRAMAWGLTYSFFFPL